jgi:hypothetical protein
MWHIFSRTPRIFLPIPNVRWFFFFSLSLMECDGVYFISQQRRLDRARCATGGRGLMGGETCRRLSGRRLSRLRRMHDLVNGVLMVGMLVPIELGRRGTLEHHHHLLVGLSLRFSLSGASLLPGMQSAFMFAMHSSSPSHDQGSQTSPSPLPEVERARSTSARSDKRATGMYAALCAGRIRQNQTKTDKIRQKPVFSQTQFGPYQTRHQTNIVTA